LESEVRALTEAKSAAESEVDSIRARYVALENELGAAVANSVEANAAVGRQCAELSPKNRFGSAAGGDSS
jgi:hypothetical protein